ncbi:hypothetical protein BKA70DRAFT_1273055 [Coprinopsis sp. MPI-PUGE-AT-0042]|nr:hypothetical protein BKA70DRAFT_1273055 [Coprinopsis sp. MPI-PUGE-AT-0042]
MSTGSPTAYLLWAVLSCIFLVFLILHLWLYDRFNCLRWDSGRQPGAFKRVMTYSYLSTLPLLVAFSVTMTKLKFSEGFIIVKNRIVVPRPFDAWSPEHHRYILPLFFVLSVAWSLEIVTHLEELTFWLFLLHQGPGKRDWFHSWEYRTWYLGSLIAIVGLPVTTIITRHEVNSGLPWIFLVGSLAAFITTVCFLYVLFRFPAFLDYVKAAGADPDVVCIRVTFRFFYTIPLLLIGVDGVQAPFPYPNQPFLLMLGGIGCFISSGITLLIFFPRSVAQESGYRARVISPEASKPATETYYHDHHRHDRGTSNPMSVLGYPARPTSGTLHRDFQFPAEDQDGILYDDAGPLHSTAASATAYGGELHSKHTVSRVQSRQDEQRSQRQLQAQQHPIQHSISQPPRSRGSGTKSDDTVWEEDHDHPAIASLPSLRRHSDGPFIHHRNGKSTVSRTTSRVESSAHHERHQSSRCSSQLHPYVLNFTSPIDLMDARVDDRGSFA